MNCSATTKKNKPCPIPLESWRKNGLCHVHDPERKFRQQQGKKGYKNHTKILGCSHKWYMREPGIQCTKCLIVWDKSMETDSEFTDT
jgi:hypothetical protein